MTQGVKRSFENVRRTTLFDPAIADGEQVADDPGLLDNRRVSIVGVSRIT